MGSEQARADMQAGNRFAVLGHRGAKGHAPENTLASFEKGVELGATMVELDIHLSRDDELVVMHDPKVDRTTDGAGRIRDLTWSEIRRLDAGGWFNSSFKGQRVPHLQEVIEAVGDRVLINIEIKSGVDGPYAEITEKMAALLEQNRFVSRTVVSSFEPAYLRELRPRLPDLELALLYAKDRENPIEEAQREGWQTLHPNRRHINAEFVAAAHAHGLIVRAWNPNDPDVMRPLIEAGVDGIGTDYPERLLELLQSMGRGVERTQA